MQPPAQLTSLIGRERDVEEVVASLAATRLMTLTGAGGVGKTRLAVAASARAAAEFPDGVYWIELAAVADPGAVAPTLAQTLGVRALPGLSELDAVVGYLYERRALLVLDNCEHLAEEVARVAAALLRVCPALAILATSRAPLAIRGETRWAVPPLSMPDAARLFVDRARRVDRRWSLTDADAIAEICRKLDGIPLALELAAARVGVLRAGRHRARARTTALGLLSRRCSALAGLELRAAAATKRSGCCARWPCSPTARRSSSRAGCATATSSPPWRRSPSTRWCGSTAGATGCWRPCASTRSRGSKTPARPRRSAIATATRSWHWPSARAGMR